ncbi:STAS domain-containing protein [Rhizobium sp. L1K21]|uniref:STAS domain-containing protein n=1 Tax=Rhizobium sp. L1K21 TaxID=2954933 RepID=UPI002092CCD0|nr:STAS domain-containing protein [Rhizobium sp. L1K21]MCO6187149.1 STAS domain-containing protein [Rhizobium sp. L1K21]
MAGKDTGNSITLAAVLDFNEASELHGKLMSMRGKDVTIDASAVQRAGAQCMQVIFAAAKSWEEDKKSIKFEKVSDAFKATMQLAGVNFEPLIA